MNKSQNKPNRRSIRLKEYDYSQAGAYFVTIVVHHRIPLFGNIENEIIFLNPAGLMIEQTWVSLPGRLPSIELDEYCVMPNHFHGIVVIKPLSIIETKNLTAQSDLLLNSRAATRATPTLGSVIGAFKSISTYEYIKCVRNNDWSPFNKILW